MPRRGAASRTSTATAPAGRVADSPRLRQRQQGALTPHGPPTDAIVAAVAASFCFAVSTRSAASVSRGASSSRLQTAMTSQTRDAATPTVWWSGLQAPPPPPPSAAGSARGLSLAAVTDPGGIDDYLFDVFYNDGAAAHSPAAGAVYPLRPVWSWRDAAARPQDVSGADGAADAPVLPASYAAGRPLRRQDRGGACGGIILPSLSSQGLPGVAGLGSSRRGGGAWLGRSASVSPAASPRDAWGSSDEEGGGGRAVSPQGEEGGGGALQRALNRRRVKPPTWAETLSRGLERLHELRSRLKRKGTWHGLGARNVCRRRTTV